MLSIRFEQFHFSYEIRNLGHGFVGLRELLSEMYKLGVFTAEDFADEVERFSDLLWVDYHFASEFSCMKFVNFSDHAGRKLAFHPLLCNESLQRTGAEAGVGHDFP